MWTDDEACAFCGDRAGVRVRDLTGVERQTLHNFVGDRSLCGRSPDGRVPLAAGGVACCYD